MEAHTGGVRARARAALLQDIKDVARRQIRDVGSSGLSLRAVARELGLVSSALYRYYASRDDLLTALIVDSYNDVGAAAERAADGSGTFVQRWLAVAVGIREWAVGNPHDYALVYGSPVPGYRAPADTIPAASRVSVVALGLLRDGVASGEVLSRPGGRLPAGVRRDLAALRRDAAPGVPDDVLARGMAAWSQLFGALSFELYGHLQNVVHDHAAYFESQMRAAAGFVAGQPASMP